MLEVCRHYKSTIQAGEKNHKKCNVWDDKMEMLFVFHTLYSLFIPKLFPDLFWCFNCLLFLIRMF